MASKLSNESLNSYESGSHTRQLSLDGLRGVAVLMVLLHHHQYLDVGWMGVDIFFVLSGYLITSHLRRARMDEFFWGKFWLKRTTRILPPFLLLLTATMLAGFASTLLQTLGYLLSFGDLLAYLRPSFAPLRPLWSLAVEEHFYIAWPFAVRLLPRRALLYILCGLLVCEPGLRAVASVASHNWQFVYFLTPFRLDGLALGSLLSLALESPVPANRIRNWSGLASVVFVLIWGVCRIHFGDRFTREYSTVLYNTACYSIVALFSAACVAYLLSHPKSVAARGLTWTPLVFTGTISYGLYLYQVLISEVSQRAWHLSDRQALWVDTPIIFFFSWLSFSFYEKRIMHWGKEKIDASRSPVLQVIDC